jgi:hypothetical protein
MAQKAMTYVTLSGGKTGRYVVRKEQKDGKLLLEPDTSAQAMLKRHGLKRSSHKKFAGQHVPLLPPDGEG